jgi:hypothetical protein
MKLIDESIELLKEYIEKNKYKGYDPYDALKSPFFKLPILKKNKFIRFGIQQLIKRIPFNLRHVLLVPKGYNPVTLGLCIQAYGYLSLTQPEKKEYYYDKIKYLIQELIKLIPNGFSGACWGYDFDWEARNAKIPAYQPTVVATGIITNGLFECWKITKLKICSDLIISSSNFVLKDLNRTYENDTFCFSYSPFDNQSVLNASMKGVRILAHTFALTKNTHYLDVASKATEYVLKKQKEDGSFMYSDKGMWIDNYHTGYILDALDEYVFYSGKDNLKSNLIKGYEFYRSNFFTENFAPKFYDKKMYPIDCTAAAQSLLTLSRFNNTENAEKVARYIIVQMQRKNGSFIFRKFSNYKITTSFMRWSNAWMFAGLCYLKYKKFKS